MKSLAQNGVTYLSGEVIQPDTVIAVDQIQYLSFKPDYNWNGTTFFTWKAITGSVESLNQALGNITISSFTDDIVIYDGFSPNGDRMNDQWIIGNIQDYPHNQVKIFNRYNLLIYQQANYDNEARVWKGETNVTHFNQEHQAPDDIYYYLISLDGDQKIFKGSVILKR
jgi:gliding motility-associated-like protein